MSDQKSDTKETKTLVIVLAQTRAHELTFENFRENVLDRLDADLCVCIGVTPEYDKTNKFYQTAKYKFTYDEPEDYGVALEDARNELMINNDHCESTIHWRQFLKLKDQFLGGVRDNDNQHDGSAGILIFFRWFLLKRLKESGLIYAYDRFVITRSDFIYRLPHPRLHQMNPNYIWIPDEEDYGGFTDRHVVLSRSNIEQYLSIFNSMVLHSNNYFTKMSQYPYGLWNLERLIKFHLNEIGAINQVRRFPYVMYSVRAEKDATRWQVGTFNETLGYYVKYQIEFIRSFHYKQLFQMSGLDIDQFYESVIIL